MKQMVRMMLAMLAFFMMQATLKADGLSADLRKKIYTLNALQSVVELQVDISNQDNSWRDSQSADFSNDDVMVQMDIDDGPGYYRGFANWNDKWGNALFSSSEYKLVYFKAGMNLKDFPVYLSPGTTLHLKIDGPSNSDGVWINKNQAWFSDGYWHAYIEQPWMVDSLDVIWDGHGSWTVGVSPSFKFDSVIQLTGTNMDHTEDIVAQMTAVSYPGEGSWTDGVASYERNIGDPQGNPMIELITSIPYGTKVMVFFNYYDQNLGMVEYYNTTVKVTDVLVDGTIMSVPLSGTWFNLGQTQVRIVWQDTNGKYWQSWVSISTSDGKG